MSLELWRDEAGPDGILGELMVPSATGALFLQTLEDDWKENQPNESCIPAGEYPVRRTVFHKHDLPTFEILVPGRSRILFHPGNTEEDTAGCVLLGLERGELSVHQDEDTGAQGVTKRAVLNSKEAFAQFMAAMEGIDETTIRVEWGAGLPPKTEGDTA